MRKVQMPFDRSIKLLLVLIVIPIYSFSQNDKNVSNAKAKFNPGHYVAVGPFFELSEIKHLDSKGLRGINKRYYWRTLESKKDEYNLSFIEEDLEYCARHNKQLVVFICDRSFWKKGALPSYLKDYEWHEEGGGFIPVRWNQEYVKRFIALGRAISERFDAHPNFEGVAIQETSLGMPEDVLLTYDYTSLKYKNALLTILNEFALSFSTSNVFWYQNGIEGTNKMIREIADSILYRKNIIMGGPDILPYRKWLSQTYKIYGDYKGQMKLFCSAQDDSYRHHKNDIRLSENEPIHEEGYLTMEDIFRYGRDDMHINYLFWNYYYEGDDNGERSFDDAVEVIQKHPTFNHH